MASMSPKSKFLLALGGCALGAYVAVLLVGRVTHGKELHAIAEESAIPSVATILPHQADSKVELTLPGTIDAWYQAPIYAQVSGYVKMWYKDYGAAVHQGDVLAEINAPALDAQYAQALADLDAQKAKYHLATVTANRWRAMGRSQAVSGQSVSVAIANEQAASANMQAAQRNVDHFAALEKFKQIIAPFDGVVTTRSINVGDYVNSGGGQLNASGGASELFTVADTHRLRLFVSVPEIFSYMLTDGLTAQLHVPQYPDRTFTANFLTASHGYDPNTRTAVAEFTLDNADHALWPGTFASVGLKANNNAAHLLKIPTGALVFQEKGMQVATVDEKSHVHFKNIHVGKMADSSTEVQAGIDINDHIINNPPADLLEGDPVRVVTPARGYNQSGWEEPSDED